jgi:hypothetical protein
MHDVLHIFAGILFKSVKSEYIMNMTAVFYASNVPLHASIYGHFA